MVAERLFGRTAVDLDQSRWCAAYLPSIAVGVLFLRERVLEFNPVDSRVSEVVVILLLMMAVSAVGAYAFVACAFNALRRDQEEILKQSHAVVALPKRFRVFIENSSDVMALTRRLLRGAYAFAPRTGILGLAVAPSPARGWNVIRKDSGPFLMRRRSRFLSPRGCLFLPPRNGVLSGMRR